MLLNIVISYLMLIFKQRLIYTGLRGTNKNVVKTKFKFTKVVEAVYFIRKFYKSYLILILKW